MAENSAAAFLKSEESSDKTERTVRTATSDGATVITIHQHYCKGCDICADVCPKDVLEMVAATDRWEGTIVEIINIDNCNACMLCEYECPDFAIEIYNEKKEKKKEKKAL